MATTSIRFIPSSKANPCPICGRTKDGDCRISAEGFVLCRRGGSSGPPAWARRKGDHGPGRDGGEWAYLGDETSGQWAEFKPHQPAQAKPIRPASTRRWEYEGRDGQPLIEVIRDDDGKGGRKIHQRSRVERKRPADLQDQVMPYRYREALEAVESGEQCVFWVEGEPCADALWSLGLPAVSSIGGAGNFNPARDGSLFPPEKVVIVPDRDRPGISHGNAVASAYPGARWLLCWPNQPHFWNGGCPEKGGLDVADWIAEGARAEQLMAAITAEGPTGWPEEQPSLPAETARQRLTQALAEDASGADMEVLLADLAKQTGMHAIALRQMVEALQAEAHGVGMVTAETERLRERIAQHKAGQALTLKHLFPPPIAEALELRTRYLPADPCAVAALFLPSIASLQKIGSRITGSPASGFTVPLNCWGGIVAKSGQKKTPLLGKVVRDPTATIRQGLAEGNRRDHQQWQEAQKLRGKGDKAEPKTPQPQPVHLHVGDVTAEALAALLVTLAERGRGVLVLRDELAGLFSGLDQYKGGRGNDGQFLLELFDGGSHTSLRLSGAREFRDSLVSITGCIQPEVLAKLVNASTGDADGRYARFLLAPLTQAPKPLPVAIDPEEQEAIDLAGQYLQKVADSIHRAPPVHLQLGPDALELFAQYEHRQARAAAAATIPAQGAVLGKSAGKVLRVAGLLHRLDGIANGTTGTTVGADPLLRAIDLVEHLNGWVLGLHADLTAGCEPTGLMRKIHDTATALKEPLQWRKFRDRLTAGQKKTWDKPGFIAAARALEGLEVGRVEPGPNGTDAYVATEALP